MGRLKLFKFINLTNMKIYRDGNILLILACFIIANIILANLTNSGRIEQKQADDKQSSSSTNANEGIVNKIIESNIYLI
jgi:hypothetical protein